MALSSPFQIRRKLRILVLHNTYLQPGGEDAVVAQESALLRGAGHDVTVRLVHNSDVRGLAGKLRTLARASHDPGRKVWMAAQLAQHQPDVVHIHNFWPQLTPAVHAAALEAGVPVIQTLHNYRLGCAGAMLLRDGAVCEKCVRGSPYWGVWHRCYRGSRPASWAVTQMRRQVQKTGYFRGQACTFVALTEFARRKFIELGVDPAQITVQPNTFSGDGLPPPIPQAERRGILFVGRLSPEKGVATLIRAVAGAGLDHPVRILGAGPEEAALRQLDQSLGSGVTFLGAQPREAVLAEMARAALLVMPSTWYEGFPVTLLEAYASGLPVVASEIGSLVELIERDVTGDLVPPGDPVALRAALIRLLADPGTLARLSDQARQRWHLRYRPAQTVVGLEAIYHAALAAPRREAIPV